MNGSANPMGLPIEWRHESIPPNPTTEQGGGGGGFGEQRGLDGGRNESEQRSDGGIDLQGDDGLWQPHPHPQTPMAVPSIPLLGEPLSTGQKVFPQFSPNFCEGGYPTRLQLSFLVPSSAFRASRV